VFVAYPSSGVEKPVASSPQPSPAAQGASGLDDVNLTEIEGMLDLDIEETKKTAPAEPDFNLDLEEDVAGPPAHTEFEETQELDFSDMDIDDSGGSAEASEDLDLDLGLDFEDTDSASEVSEPEAAGDESSDELDFELDLDLDESADAGAAASDMELEETQELDVSDMDNLLDLDEQPAAESGSDELDFDLDLESGPEAGSDEPDAGAMVDDATDELDFTLDLESDSKDSDAGAAAGSEATAELELSELDDMIDMEEEPAADEQAGAAADDLDFELDLEPDATPKADDVRTELELEETEEFDVTDLDEMLVDDDQPSQKADAAEVSDDLDFKLDIAEESPPQVASDAEFEETAEFDLSDLEDMLEDEDEPAAIENAGGAEDLDMALDMEAEPEPVADLYDDDAADVELEFEIEDNEATGPQTADAAAATTPIGEQEALDDTFDMGQFTDDADAAEVADAELAYEMLGDEELAPRKKPKPPARRGLSGPFRVLLLLVLLVGGGYAVYTLSETTGLKIPFIDELKGIKIPYVSDLLGTKVPDPGNLKIRIDARRVDGWYVENTKAGTIFVIKGRVKNIYNHPRNFIRITAKVYSKGGRNSRVQTVYAGNLLSDNELTTLAPTDIQKRLNKRFGDKKSNLKVKTGKSVPFMVVFSKLPPNPNEYTVEVAGSVKG
jgi:hypothetical protein